MKSSKIESVTEILRDNHVLDYGVISVRKRYDNTTFFLTFLEYIRRYMKRSHLPFQ